MMNAARVLMVTLGLMVAGSALGDAGRVDLSAGSAVYDRTCSMCHQRGATGVAGMFPPLAGRIGPISASDAGRRYLLSVLVYGVAGSIKVNDQTYQGVMPPVSALSDEDIANVLNHLGRLSANTSKTKPFTAAEVTAVREGPKLSIEEVRALREPAIAQVK